ncbi:MAG TPA: HAD family phosphatase [Thermomicrobiales bacterium]|nr:HAD family phosphatase [Thermomicrobiales bacterium]
MATPERPPLAAVVFDMDGLLVDTETISHRAWEAYLARDHGATLGAADYAAIVGTYGLDTWTIVRDRLGLPLDLPADLPRLDAAVDAVYRGLLAAGVAPLPGAVELARACRAAGLRLGVASSSPLARVAEIVASVGLAGVFDALTSGEEVHYSKPDPAIYRLACARLGVPPAAAVAIEDSGPGILAARAAGLRALAVPSVYTTSHDLSAASAVVPSLVGVTPAVLAALPW